VGEVLYADLVGADGAKTRCRMPSRGSTTDRRRRAMLRIAVVCTDLMLEDPELRAFVETPEMTAWMAPGRHLMASAS
jgi:salicylate hydroxylase